ncbi:hypothetical protein NC651_009732 [Populus alba x Populus x berolinensis]|nr:hypothetical protein NC651_009732 [Populus alba x Populus x berolinensis]
MAKETPESLIEQTEVVYNSDGQHSLRPLIFSRKETHRLCSMKCWSSPSCKDCAISSFRSLIPRPRFSSAANGLPLQLPSSLLLPDD